MLHLDERQLDELRDHARAAYPREACGLLVGRATATGALVESVHSIENRSRERDRFVLDAAEHLAVSRAADSAGQRVVGVWHSHPDGAPVPSRVDLEGAWPGWSYLIVAVAADGGARCASWRLEGGRFAAEELA